jgi:predicted TIM-barrel fold metal-dependent hydrolase
MKDMLKAPLPAVNDAEGSGVPPGLPDVTDAHVHLFPDRVFDAVWQWFDTYGWPIRYRLHAPRALDFLYGRGVKHVVGLCYSHRPGVARMLNEHMAGLCRLYPGRLTGLATVFPGEEGAEKILEEAFGAGLAGVKLHLHVQCFDILSPELAGIYEICEQRKKPLVMHAGREPRSPAYRCDPHALCGAAKLEQVLAKHPGLRICVPHLGADEFEAFAAMLERFDNLWLDTTMALAGYLPGPAPPALASLRPDRVIYGTDFPNIPYAWDRELGRLAAMGLPSRTLELVLGKNAQQLFSLEPL